MKSILISIRPKWVAKILNGEKTIEIRKTAPKCELPVDVYIYCTEPHAKEVLSLFVPEVRPYVDGRAAEFIERKRVDKPNMRWSICNGKVVAKFTLRKISEIVNEMRTDLDDSKYPSYFAADMSEHKLLGNAYLTAWEIHNYLKLGKGYAWHIEDLEIFNQPKKLDDFDYPNPSGTVYVGQRSLNGLPSKKHPPQSWCYVEEKE